MKKFAVIKDKNGNVSWQDHSKESYPECEILHTTDCAQECINICLLHWLPPDHKIITAIKFDWISRLN